MCKKHTLFYFVILIFTINFCFDLFAQTANYSGWYRTRLKLFESSTCDTEAMKNSEIVLFLQIRQNGKKIWADFCPSISFMSGTIKNQIGTLKSTENFGGKNQAISISKNPCSENKFKEIKTVTIQKLLDKTNYFNFTYTIERICTEKNSKNKSCVEKFIGQGIYETHTIWPTLDSNPEKIQNACNEAKKSCNSCHPQVSVGLK
jgi:hypothetical protein